MNFLKRRTLYGAHSDMKSHTANFALGHCLMRGRIDFPKVDTPVRLISRLKRDICGACRPTPYARLTKRVYSSSFFLISCTRTTQKQRAHPRNKQTTTRKRKTTAVIIMTAEIKHCDRHVPYSDNDAIRKEFQEQGYVVLTDVLSPEEVTSALDELWTSPRLLGRPGIDRDDKSTWNSEEWPQSNGGKNFLASADSFQDATSWDLTSHERVVGLQRLLYQKDDLMCDGLGRWGVMRPTLNHPEWKTDASWLHWDQNPWTEPGFVRLQAIVCLTDNTATSGGFACVPGFHKRFQQWGQEHQMGTVLTPSGKVLDESYGAQQPFPIPLDDPCQQEVVRVLAPAGAMVIWDSRLPHQNFPNTDASAMRIVHYTMMLVKKDKAVREHRKLLQQKQVVMDALGISGARFPYALTPLGKEINCLDENDESLVGDVTDELEEAIPLVLEAGRAEERGDVGAAIKCHQKALRLYPDIEEWYPAIMR